MTSIEAKILARVVEAHAINATIAGMQAHNASGGTQYDSHSFMTLSTDLETIAGEIKALALALDPEPARCVHVWGARSTGMGQPSNAYCINCGYEPNRPAGGNNG